jgi:hypothetical protein
MVRSTDNFTSQHAAHDTNKDTPARVLTQSRAGTIYWHEIFMSRLNQPRIYVIWIMGHVWPDYYTIIYHCRDLLACSCSTWRSCHNWCVQLARTLLSSVVLNYKILSIGAITRTNVRLSLSLSRAFVDSYTLCNVVPSTNPCQEPETAAGALQAAACFKPTTY